VNRVLRRTGGPERDEITEGRKRNLDTEGLHNLYCLLNIILAIKSGGMR
jgi:hypothetical protein